jgi:hypothetical protein
LYSILLDSKNIKLKENVDLLEKNHVTLTEEKNTIKNNIKDFEDFIILGDMHKIVDIDKKLKENDNQKKQFISQAQLANLSIKSSFNYDFDFLEGKLKQNIDTTLESKISEHIKNNHKDGFNSKNFLKDGIDLILDSKNCPFCGQSLNNVADHIETLRSFFSATYKEIQESINESIKLFSQIDIEKEINAFKLCGLEFENIKIEEVIVEPGFYPDVVKEEIKLNYNGKILKNKYKLCKNADKIYEEFCKKN